MKRYALVVPLFASVLIACSPGTQGSDGSVDQPDLTTSSNPDLAQTPGCTDGTACQASGQSGLCASGACAPCVDTTDDAACAAAYGAGNICANGACVVGCHDSSSCAGKICDTGSATCRDCTQDAECPAANPVCNAGVCGQPVACTNETKCGTNGWCCGTTCNANTGKKGCCANGDCASGTCNMTTHICKPDLCTAAAPNNKLYVDPDATDAMSGVGSTQCPYQSLDAALTIAKKANPTTNFTICTKGTFDSTKDNFWPRYIPKNVELDGTYCDNTSTTHTIFKVPQGNDGVTFHENAPASIHGYDIIYQGTKHEHDGIYITNSGNADQINIHDVTINGFQFGVHAGHATGDASGANALIFRDTQLNKNNTGLLLAGDAKVEVNVTNAVTTRAEFNNNDFQGIRVDDSGSLTVKGAVFTGTGATTSSRTVRADFNTSDGLWLTSKNAKANLDFFSGSSNTRQGLSFLNTSNVTVTNSVFTGNTIHGIYITPDGASKTLTNVNLGTTATGTTAGHNLINNNTQAGICVNFDDSANPLAAQGNNFGTGKDCSMPSPANKVTVAWLCGRGVDVAGINGGFMQGTLVTVDGCMKQDCSTIFSSMGCPQ